MGLRAIYIGDLNVYTESRSKLEAFKSIGWSVKELTSVPIPHFPGLGKSKNIFHRAVSKLRPMRDLTGINSHLSEMARTGEISNFDIIWSDKAINLNPLILRRIKRDFPSVKMVFASGDNMAIPAFRNQAFLQTIDLFDVVMTMKSGTEKSLQELGARKVVFIPKSYDSSWESLFQKREKLFDISFIGSFERERSLSMLALAESGLKVDIWGNGWGSFRKRHPNLIIHGRPVYHEEMIKTIEQSKINLCFLRKLAEDKSTNRTFELPACRGFMMAEYSKEQCDYFPADEAAVFFTDNNELVDKCRYFLTHDLRREEIAECGYMVCKNSGYSYKDRAIHFMKYVWPQI